MSNFGRLVCCSLRLTYNMIAWAIVRLLLMKGGREGDYRSCWNGGVYDANHVTCHPFVTHRHSSQLTRGCTEQTCPGTLLSFTRPLNTYSIPDYNTHHIEYFLFLSTYICDALSELCSEFFLGWENERKTCYRGLKFWGRCHAKPTPLNTMWHNVTPKQYWPFPSFRPSFEVKQINLIPECIKW